MDLDSKHCWKPFYTFLQVFSFNHYWDQKAMTSQSQTFYLCTEIHYDTDSVSAQGNSLVVSNSAQFSCLILTKSKLLLYTLISEMQQKSGKHKLKPQCKITIHLTEWLNFKKTDNIKCW